MHKPLYLNAGNSGREFERRSLFRTKTPVAEVTTQLLRLENAISKREPIQSTEKPARVHVLYPKQQQPADQRNVDFPLKNKSKAIDIDDAPSIEKPRSIKSYRSDRIAIYDERTDTFHAYSVTEAISQPGLSFQEAVDWVDDRLVLVGKSLSPKNMTVALSLMLASSAIAVMLIVAFIRFIF